MISRTDASVLAEPVPEDVQRAIDRVIEYAVDRERRYHRNELPVCERKLRCYIGGQIEVAIYEPEYGDVEAIELDDGFACTVCDATAPEPCTHPDCPQ